MTSVYPADSPIPRSQCPVEVVIIGAGLSGTLAAILLGRIGCKVALIDLHPVYPPDFRAEQLVGYQVELLSRLGLRDILIGGVVPASRAVATRAGRTIGIVSAPHYGIPYEEMVNRARRHLPLSVRFIQGKVLDIELAADRQRVKLCNGDLVEARLVMLATGLGQRLLHHVGIARTTIHHAQSLAFGFDLQVASPGLFASSVFVAFGRSPADRIDYLTLFSIDNKLRGNLFTYHDLGDPWIKQFKNQPQELLRNAFPNLEQTIGTVQSIDSVQLRFNDLATATNYRRDGVVLVGDAFQTSSPAAGTGIGRLLNDIDRLCNHHIPAWLATDGMNADKIGQFYDDPVKRICDAEALRVARYRRSVTVEPGFRWTMHRQRVSLQNQLLSVLPRWRKPGDQRRLRLSLDGPNVAPAPLHR